MTGQILDIKLFIPDRTAHKPTLPAEALRVLGGEMLIFPSKSEFCRIDDDKNGAMLYQDINVTYRTYDADDPHKGLECLGDGCVLCGC